MATKPLKPRALYRTSPVASLPFRSTDDLADLDVALGQERAVEALEFGIGMRQDGYNLYVLGPSGTGRHALVRQVLKTRARAESTPTDWVYVDNFEIPHRPRAIDLPRGRALAFSHDMDRMIGELQAALPAIFESDEFRTRRQAIDEEFKERQEQTFQAVQEEAQKRDLALIRTPTGLALAPMQAGEVMAPEAFNKLPEPVRKKIEADINELQSKLMETVQKLPDWEAERRHRVRELTREVTRLAVANLIAALKRNYADLPKVSAYLEEVAHDIAENVDNFLPQERAGPAEMLAGMAMRQDTARAGALKRYKVNVMVGDGSSEGAAVVTEDLPTQPNLIGRVEYMQELGALKTDFTQIKPGALHRANGGYLVLDALKVLQQPAAWEALKRAIQGRAIKIESPAQMMGLVSTVSLDPEPIPLDVKVVLIGDRQLYYLLCRADPDFTHLFKVAVDFEEELPRTDETALAFARLIATQARRFELKPLARPAVARIIEHASRLAGDSERLSLETGRIDDLLRESDHFAAEAGRRIIQAEDVETAIRGQIRRADRIRERSQEMILRETVLIDTVGREVGQINGLAVLQIGNFAFGRPNRITARVRMGTGEVVDIERRVDLGGPLHSKGVLILSSFLGARFATDHPLSLWASLVFEQSYSGVDGDSASSAELYTLLSALAELPIRQGLAVTGSVNQLGQVQAIGGVNEKIEGFFDICTSRGLSGEQGVLIPEANVKHLMLKREVVEAVRQGRFQVYPIATIDQGIELLTGTRAGNRRKDGSYAPGTVNRLVQDRLLDFADKRRSFGRRSGNDGNREAAGKSGDAEEKTE
ncbi:MAG: ATP-binding protein [Alphaproteobacteria bacterium]|nr:ATP-binding protein [Alphaproteobacteria bacterium]